ncbi:hypothetical protein BJ741DRAFT_671806 [Chytriomyces cf. hyalinus JEL632]|nr:hypothetical protein BJ741DRAFT_671806 [Chytriomyces cf. hyalinus JEL632]
MQDPKADPNDWESQQIQRHNQNMLAASLEGQEDVVQLPLSDSKWDFEESGDPCDAECGAPVAVQLLLSITDVDINAYEVSEGTVSSPLREARKNGHTDVVEYLLKDPRLDLHSIANKQ